MKYHEYKLLVRIYDENKNLLATIYLPIKEDNHTAAASLVAGAHAEFALSL